MSHCLSVMSPGFIGQRETSLRCRHLLGTCEKSNSLGLWCTSQWGSKRRGCLGDRWEDLVVFSLPPPPPKFVCWHCWLLFRRGSRISIDRFPKREPKAQASRGVRGHAPPLENVLDFNSLKSPFLGFLVTQTGYSPVPPSSDEALRATWEVASCKFSLEKIYTYIMKNLTDFRKTVETDVDPRLLFLLSLTSHCFSKLTMVTVCRKYRAFTENKWIN